MKNLKILIIEMVGILLIPFVFYNLNVFCAFISNSNTIELSSNEAMLLNLNKNGSFYQSTSDDPGIVFQNLDVTIQNFTVSLSNANNESFKAVLYLDKGNGFNENDTVYFTLKPGVNFVKIKPSSIYSLRFDPSNEDHCIYSFNEIQINNKVFNYKSLLILIPYLGFIIFLFKKKLLKIYTMIPVLFFVYLGFSFYYQTSNLILRFVYFLIIILAITFLCLYFKEEIMDDIKKNK